MKKCMVTIVILLAFTLQLFGCKSEVYEYTQEHAKVNDPCGSGWLVNGNLAVVSDERNTYRFDNDIPEETRREYIGKQQELCELLEENGISAQGLQLYVLTDIVSRSIHAEQAAYIDVSHMGSFQQVSLTLQAALGEYSNYGYIYALSNEIARRLDWATDEFGGSDADCLSKNPELLNLVYPCFSEEYFDEEEINACKALSQWALSKMSDIFEGEQVFQAIVQSYADINKIDFVSTYLGFTVGGEYCPLKIRTDYLEIYLSSDYEGSYTLTSKTIREDPMFNLDSMIEFWEFADRDIKDVRTDFGLNNDYMMPVYVQSIYIKMNEGGEYGGYYTYGEDGGQITLAQITAITHEYAHYADYSTDTNTAGNLSWCREVLACYYGKNMDFVSTLIIAESAADDVWTISDLSYVIGQRYDSVEDEILFQNILTAYADNYHYAVISSYDGRLSFGVYFVETYGEEVFVKCMQNPNAAPMLIGRSVDDAVDDWCLWLEQFKVLD